MLCIHGLITLLVLQFMGNIRRKGHLPQLIQDFFKYTLIRKLDKTISLFHYIKNLSYEKPVPKADLCAGFCLFPRFYQSLPDIVFLPLQKEDLNACIGAHLTAVQPRRDHPGVIDHQAVSRIQVIQHMAEIGVDDFPGLLIQMHQPGRGTVRKGILGDQLLRQIIIKI